MMYRIILMIVISLSMLLTLAAQQQIQILTDYAIYNVNGSPDGGYSMGLELNYSKNIHSNWIIHGGLEYLKVEELNDFSASSYNSTFNYEDEVYSDIIVGRSWGGLLLQFSWSIRCKLSL